MTQHPIRGTFTFTRTTGRRSYAQRLRVWYFEGPYISNSRDFIISKIKYNSYPNVVRYKKKIEKVRYSTDGSWIQKGPLI